MRSRLILASLVVIVGIGVFAGTLLATPPSKVTPTEYGIGTFSPFATSGRIGAWGANINIKGATDIHVLSNKIAPGGNFGWHSHPGPSFVIIKSGTATVYFGADPACRPHRYRAGSGFVDKGLETHIVRNEGKVALVTVVVSFTPRGATRRIDESDPGNCHFEK
jgi:quercetin dioxygenase-like cupin family protein